MWFKFSRVMFTCRIYPQKYPQMGKISIIFRGISEKVESLRLGKFWHVEFDYEV